MMFLRGYYNKAGLKPSRENTNQNIEGKWNCNFFQAKMAKLENFSLNFSSSELESGCC